MNHISIEGMDGVGKSTTCELLAKKLNYKFIEKPLHYLFDDNNNFTEYIKIRDKVNQNCDRNFTSWFYGLGSLYMYDLCKNDNIVTDRHLASNYAWSGTDYNLDIYNLLIKKLGKPKLTVILYSPTEVIINRLIKRNKNDSDIKKAQMSEKIYDRMISFCKDHEFNYVVIDTSNLTPDEVTDIIVDKLQEVENE